MKRFYEAVSVESQDSGWTIALDGREMKTPGKAPLLLPTRALADAVATEWSAQADDIQPDSMPQMQLASTAIDRVVPRLEGVAEEVAAFGGTDLLCYRADDAPDLAAKQARIWDPYLKWAEKTFGARLEIAAGIMPITQSTDALTELKKQVSALDAFELTALHAFTNGFGSLLLALAYMNGYSSLDDAWQASILDAVHQEESWGTDWEIEDKRKQQYAELVAAATFLSHLRN